MSTRHSTDIAAPFDAVVFDFDGVIIDTELPLFRAWQEVFELYACEPLSVEEWGRCLGAGDGTLDVVRLLQERAGVPVDLDRAQWVRREINQRLLDAEVVRPGVLEWLAECGRIGIATAIASSAPADWVHTHLDRFGIRGRFGAIVCADGRLAPKPAPDTYREACRLVGAEPSRSVAVEDSANGCHAAAGAGLFCVIVPHALTYPREVGQHLTIESLEELGVSELSDRRVWLEFRKTRR